MGMKEIKWFINWHEKCNGFNANQINVEKKN